MIKASSLTDFCRTALNDKWGYIWGTSGIKWTEARQRQLEQTTDSSRANSRKYGKQWIGHMVADCSGLIYGFFSRNGEKMTHGSDTMYRSYCTAKGSLKKGQRSDGKPLLPGSAVFIWHKDDGKYGHVGVYVGDGKVIEAIGAKNGVVTSDLAGKWTHWGELKGVDYSGMTDDPGQEPEPVPEPGDKPPTLRIGDRGDWVAVMQTKLVNLGYSVGASGVDGDFGRATAAAVRQFQKDWGLVEDAICGPKTWAVLESTLTQVFYTVTIPGLNRAAADALIATYPDATIKEERGASE